MKADKSINELKKYIKYKYDESKKPIMSNVYRGHSKTMSADIEDAIAKLISCLKPKCKLYLDPSVNVDNKNYRPDLLIVNENNDVTALVEIKANMGWHRKADDVVDKIVNYNRIFKKEKNLNCKFSLKKEETFPVNYGNDVKLFLVSLTNKNCSDDIHKKNRHYGKKKEVTVYNLFSGWYDNLEDLDIRDFIEKIKKL